MVIGDHFMGTCDLLCGFPTQSSEPESSCNNNFVFDNPLSMASESMGFLSGEQSLERLPVYNSGSDLQSPGAENMTGGAGDLALGPRLYSSDSTEPGVGEAALLDWAGQVNGLLDNEPSNEPFNVQDFFGSNAPTSDDSIAGETLDMLISGFPPLPFDSLDFNLSDISSPFIIHGSLDRKYSQVWRCRTALPS
ncbi:hypothetical protein BDZ45DRAFT_74302 [Acephala macrosclerotiorum]|nr:hypothetical protein BDZ45DRAFT_74302 [Acephala macrosclerotiorum]